MAAKVTVRSAGAPAPGSIAEQMALAAPDTHAIDLPDGRVVELRKPGVLAQFRLVKILDAETAKNEVYMQMVFPILYVSKIDGDFIAFPQSERELEATITRLDEAGVGAVMLGVHAHWGTPKDEDRDGVKK